MIPSKYGVKSLLARQSAFYLYKLLNNLKNLYVQLQTSQQSAFYGINFLAVGILLYKTNTNHD